MENEYENQKKNLANAMASIADQMAMLEKQHAAMLHEIASERYTRMLKRAEELVPRHPCIKLIDSTGLRYFVATGIDTEKCDPNRGRLALKGTLIDICNDFELTYINQSTTHVFYLENELGEDMVVPTDKAIGEISEKLRLMRDKIQSIINS